MIQYLRITVLTLIFSNLIQAQYPQNYFQSPLDIPLILSGTYGELRSNHFHAGIDIKTQGVEGLNVRAAASGEVVRIAVSPYGYGNALYVRHPNGYTTVYAHLQSFDADIQKWVEEKQYAQKSFYVNLFPPAGTFPVMQGDVIAKSGNSGGSGGPHLHFEIRDSRTEEPINPLLFGYEIDDHRTPEVRGVYAYPLNAESHLNQRHARTELSLRTIRNGEYAFRWTQRGAGQIGFAIDVIDRLDGAWNSNGPFKIEQFVNGSKTNEFRAERFAFAETRYLNAHIDYDLYDCCSKKINRMWILPSNALRMYSGTEQNGILTVEADSSYDLQWKISDVAGNVTLLNGSIRYEALADSSSTSSDLQIPHNSVFNIDWGSFYANLGIDVLYESADVDTTIRSGLDFCYGSIYQIGRTGIPVHKHYRVGLSLADVPVKYHSKAVVVSLDDNLNSPDSWDGDVQIHNSQPFIEARVRTMGNFTLMVDSVPPAVRVLSGIRSGQQLSTGSVIKLKMTDDLSGIQSYDCYIDGQWHLMSYDAKYDLLEVELSNRIPNGEHEFKVIVTDDRNNKTEVRIPFSYSIR
ncbi:M23 family metallopeptidase [Phaeocystidibacter luteus]|uniref:M23 family metallopeptidase n=1 Tax=Phaeocystidibacter luteus TaxID=911197 RepID=A0A6N6RIH9_9FLAO|nr:M23 family metallopeptidase [Phaeocystidibacter luteus]KAB2814153.1 M23 family metallopeptidase [Phaeocystidibacter luteus]